MGHTQFTFNKGHPVPNHLPLPERRTPLPRMGASFYILYLRSWHYHPPGRPAQDLQYLGHNGMRLKSQAAMDTSPSKFPPPPSRSSYLPASPTLSQSPPYPLLLSYSGLTLSHLIGLHHHTSLSHHPHTCQRAFSNVHIAHIFLLNTLY